MTYNLVFRFRQTKVHTTASLLMIPYFGTLSLEPETYSVSRVPPLQVLFYRCPVEARVYVLILGEGVEQ